jgi:O-antigen/teichoic acid export membrane protein
VATVVPGVAAPLRGVARGGAISLAGAAVAGLAGFGVTWIVARALGQREAGGLFAATAAFTLAGTVAKLGTPTGLVYFIARLRTAGDAGLRACVRTALRPVLVAAIVAAVAMWLTAPAHLSEFRILAVLLPLAVLSDTLLAATRGWRALRPTVLLDRLLRPGLQLVALGALLLLGVRATVPYALGWVLPYTPTALLAGYALRQLLPRPEESAATEEPVSPQGFWRFTAPRAVASVAQLALQRVDILLVASLAGLRAAAVYAVAGRFLALGQLANQSILLSVQPRLAELLGAGDRAGANALYQTATGWLVLVAWPLYLGTAVFAAVYLGLFGPAYRGAVPVVVVLALAMLVATGCGMVDTVLAMAGRTSWNLANVLVALAVNVSVDLVLIPRLGALGAAVGLAAAVLTNNLVPLSQVGFVLGLHPFGRATFVAAGLATLCFGAVPVAVVAVGGTTPSTALVAAALGGTGYLFAITRLRRVLHLGG